MAFRFFARTGFSLSVRQVWRTDAITRANLIDGKLVVPAGHAYFDVYGPATGKVYARCPDSNAHDAQAAIGSRGSACASNGNPRREADFPLHVRAFDWRKYMHIHSFP